MRRFAFILFALAPVTLSGQVADRPPEIAGVVEWKCLEGKPGQLGLWVDNRFVGQLDPASGDWIFHTGRPLNLKAHVNEFNPKYERGPEPRVTNDRPASVRTENFIVQAPTKADAEAFAEVAETQRKKLAVLWLGKEMPRWREPCEMVVLFNQSGKGGGATTSMFGPGVEPRLSMKIEGNREYMLANVLPHEVSHCVLATHFRKPVPRWADEGIAVMAETKEVRAQLDKHCVGVLNAGRGIALVGLFRMREYPPGDDMLSLYSQGHSISSWLVARKDRATLLEFLSLAMRDGWDTAAKHFYEFESVDAMQKAWVEYLRAGGRKEESKAIGQNCGDECVEPCKGNCGCGCQPVEGDSQRTWTVWGIVVAVSLSLALVIRRVLR